MRSVEPVKPTAITSEVAAYLVTSAQDIGIADVRIRLGYAAAVLTDNRLGVAYTFRKEARNGCSLPPSLRPFFDRPASDLLALLESPDPIEAGRGLACENAPANKPVVMLDALRSPLHQAFSMTDVTVLSGVLVKDAKDLRQVVSEGGAMRQSSPYVRKAYRRAASLKACQRGKNDGRRR
jgi:hypothetical protein